ncbi:MAG: hypothetical protein WDN69_26815 [Aliidongia sp.]
MNLMIALLLVQIATVFFFGIEPANRRLEELEPEPAAQAHPVKIRPAG